MTQVSTRRSSSMTVVVTCILIAVLEGFDILVFGATMPSMLEDEQWGMTTVEAGFIGSLSLFGMMFGALSIGYLTDRLGRRPTLLATLAIFGLFTALCAVAPNLEIFGMLRFLAGLGFGGALPTIIALTMEYVKLERRQMANGFLQSGISVGGVLVSLSAILIIPNFGWRSLYLIGGVLSLVMLAVAFRNIPESVAFLESQGRAGEARALRERYSVPASSESSAARADSVEESENNQVKALFSGSHGLATLFFLTTTFCALLVAYGMQTWTPQMLRSSGYDLGSALGFMLTFNLGTIAGTLFLNYSAGKWGPRRTISTGFVVGAGAILVLITQPPNAVVFLVMIVIGFCSGCQPAVYGFIGVFYPVRMRGTALGAAAGIGRLGGIVGPLLVGFVMASAFGANGVFVIFAVIGLIAAVLLASVPRSQEERAAHAAKAANKEAAAGDSEVRPPVTQS